MNYFAADAGEASDLIDKLIDELHPDIWKHRCILENLKRDHQYLKSDYKVHVTKSSAVAAHRATFTLSDKSDKDLRQIRDHEYNETSDECLNFQATFDEIIHAVDISSADKQLPVRLLAKFTSYREVIDVWKCHLLRAINQDLCRQKIIDSLSDNSILILMGWAMKWLPEKYSKG